MSEQRTGEARPVRVGDRVRSVHWNKNEWPSGHEVTIVTPEGFGRSSSKAIDVFRGHYQYWRHADGAPIADQEACSSEAPSDTASMMAAEACKRLYGDPRPNEASPSVDAERALVALRKIACNTGPRPDFEVDPLVAEVRAGFAPRTEPARPDAHRDALVKIAHSPGHEAYGIACDALGWGREFLPEECRESPLSCISCDDPELGPRSPSEMTHCAGCYAVLEGELDALRKALALAVRWMGDPSDPLGTFEDIGDWFYRDTGYLRPGKSEPLECGGRDEERYAAWDAWAKQTRNHVQKVCREALSDGATVVRGGAPVSNVWSVEARNGETRAVGPWRSSLDEAEADAEHGAMRGALPEPFEEGPCD